MFICIFIEMSYIYNLTNSVIGIICILEAWMVAACLKGYGRLQQILQMSKYSLNVKAMSWTHITIKWYCTHS